MSDTQRPAEASGTFLLGGDLTVNRLGFGTMRLTGPGIWGDPADPQEALRVLRRVPELGINFVDTADAYGPFTADLLLHKALHPYRDDLVIATKAGFVRTGPNAWTPVGRPEYLRQSVELSLRHLGVERIDLLQLHRVDPKVPLAEQIGVLSEMRDEGKIRHIGMSEVGVDELAEAAAIVPVVSVQNQYNIGNRAAEDVLDYAEKNSIAFIPWAPLARGSLTGQDSPLTRIAKARGVEPSQLALAWLLRRSPVMLPIPGTSSVAHLEENTGAATIDLTDEEYDTLADAAS